MSKQIFEESPAAGESGGSALDRVRKAARQLAYDTKYKVKKSMGANVSRMAPAAVTKAYLSQLAKSPAPGPVKSLAQKILLGKGLKEEYDLDDLASTTVAKAMYKVFVDGVKPQLAEAEQPSSEERFLIVVTDKKTGNEYRRKATREKIAELRANPNIARVEITQYGKPYDKEAEKGEQTAAVKSGKGLAKRDYDGDGNVESGAKEHAGAVHNAIQRKRGLKPDGKDTTGIKEELVGGQKNIDVAAPYGKLTSDDFKKLRKTKKKVMEAFFEQKKATKDQNDTEIVSNEEKGVDNKKLIKVFPEQGVKESASHKKFLAMLDEKMNLATADMGDVIKDFRTSEAPQFKGKSKKKKQKMAIAAKLEAERKLGMREEADCDYDMPNKSDKSPKLKKMEEPVDDERQMKTKVNLVKNKLRSMGLKMSYEPEGEDIQEIPLVVAAPLIAGGLYAASKGMEGLKKKVDAKIDTARKTSKIGGDRYSSQIKQLGMSYELDGNLISEREMDEPGERDDNPDVIRHNKSLRDKKGRRMYPSGRAGYGRRPDISRDPRYGSVD